MQMLSPRAKDNEKWRKRENTPALPSFGSRLAIHPYLDTHGDGQRAPKVRLNVVCTSRVALSCSQFALESCRSHRAKRTAKMKFDSAESTGRRATRFCCRCSLLLPVQSFLTSAVFLVCSRLRAGRGVVFAKQQQQLGLPQYDRAEHQRAPATVHRQSLLDASLRLHSIDI